MALSGCWGRSAGCDLGSGGAIKLDHLLTILPGPHESCSRNDFPQAATTWRKLF